MRSMPIQERRYQHASEIQRAVKTLTAPVSSEASRSERGWSSPVEQKQPDQENKSLVGPMMLFLFGNFWMFVTIVLLLGRAVARTNPLMYSFAGVGPWLYPSTYHGIAFVCGLIAVVFFVLLGRMILRNSKQATSQDPRSGPTPTLPHARQAVPPLKPYGGPAFERRISRMAIAGAAWVPFFFVMAYLMLSVNTVTTTGTSPQSNGIVTSVPESRSVAAEPGNAAVRQSPGEPGTQGFSLIQMLLTFTVLPLGITAPFATTALGMLSINAIRQSQGRLMGLPLALADALFFPLLFIDALVFATVISLVYALGVSLIAFGLGVCISLVISIVIDVLVVRYAWGKIRLPT